MGNARWVQGRGESCNFKQDSHRSLSGNVYLSRLDIENELAMQIL